MKRTIKAVKRRGKIRWVVNLGKRLTGGDHYKRKYCKSLKEAQRHLAAARRHAGKAMSQFLLLDEKSRVGLMATFRLLEEKQMSAETAHDLLSRLEISQTEETQLTAELSVERAVAEFLKNRRELNLDPGTRPVGSPRG